MGVTIKEVILNEYTPDKLPVAVDGFQAGVFAGIFAVLDKMSEAVKGVLFPAATLISWYKTILALLSYSRAKNKNISSKLNIALEIAAILAETFAVGLFVTGSTMLGVTAIPSIFVGMVAAKFAASFWKTFYYGVRCIINWWNNDAGDSPTRKHVEDKNRLSSNAYNAFLLGVMGAAMVVVMLIPALNLAALSAVTVSEGLTLAVKAIASVIMGINAFYAFCWAIPHIRRAQKRKQAMELTEGIFTADHANVPDEEASDRVHSSTASIMMTSALSSVHSPVPSAALAEMDDMDLDLGDHKKTTNGYSAMRDKFLNLSAHHDDLIVTMGFQDQKQKFVSSLLKQQKHALLRDLGVVDPKTKQPDEEKINFHDDGGIFIRSVSPSTWNPADQTQKRLDKLYAVCLLEQLVQRGKTDNLKEKGSHMTQQTDKIAGLLQHFDRLGKTENIFHSAFRDVGHMQKLYVVVDYYLTHYVDGQFLESTPAATSKTATATEMAAADVVAARKAIAAIDGTAPRSALRPSTSATTSVATAPLPSALRSARA